MNHSSNEVKQAVAISTIYFSKKYKGEIPVTLFKTLTPLLVNGTKEKNTAVKINSEIALVTFLKLRENEEVAQLCVNTLDVGARESLQDCLNKSLKKIASQPEPKEEEFDDTYLI